MKLFRFPTVLSSFLGGGGVRNNTLCVFPSVKRVSYPRSLQMHFFDQLSRSSPPPSHTHTYICVIQLPLFILFSHILPYSTHCPLPYPIHFSSFLCTVPHLPCLILSLVPFYCFFFGISPRTMFHNPHWGMMRLTAGQFPSWTSFVNTLVRVR